MFKPLFISRDGVINTRIKSGVLHRTQLELIPGGIEALVRWYQQGYTIVMVTHQPGISQGLFDLDELEAIHAKITDAIVQAGGDIFGIFYCPHDKGDGCYCCPPATGLLDVIEIELDCTAKDALYFCDNDAEAEAAEKKSCRVVRCSAENPFAQMTENLMVSK